MIDNMWEFVELLLDGFVMTQGYAAGVLVVLFAGGVLGAWVYSLIDSILCRRRIKRQFLEFARGQASRDDLLESIGYEISSFDFGERDWKRLWKSKKRPL